MGVLRLGICVAGVYATFLLWAIAQERLVSVPFPQKDYPTRLQPHSRNSSQRGDRFPSPLFLTFVQAVASSLSALSYLLFNAVRDGSFQSRSIASIIGWSQIMASTRTARPVPSVKNTPAMLQSARMEGNTISASGKLVPTVELEKDAELKRQQVEVEERTPWAKTLPGLLLQVAAFQTSAGPIGFMALEHISYPTMVLGKSCKLIPVLLLNVILYRRRFSSHKYVVVGLVTAGISLFMLLGEKKKKSGGSDSMWGLSLLLINLFIDGLTNSTQDQIFSTYPAFTGQQMMFVMAVLTQILLAPFLVLPMPTHPWSILHHLPFPLATHLRPDVPSAPITYAAPAALESLHFLFTHPTALQPLLAFACLGGLGQLFIFETIQHFGSLTLVMVTVTRKLFTMLLSVFLFDHHLSRPQWLGVAVVFSGIGVEAGMKRRDVMRRARRDTK